MFTRVELVCMFLLLNESTYFFVILELKGNIGTKKLLINETVYINGEG